jgi:hypothetical protein
MARGDRGDEARNCDRTKVSHCKERRVAAQLLEELNKVIDPDT